MGGRHNGADARLVFRHGGEGDAGCHHTFLEELSREFHRQPALAYDDGSDRSLAGRRVLPANVESECSELLLEVAGVLPEFFD